MNTSRPQVFFDIRAGLVRNSPLGASLSFSFRGSRKLPAKGLGRSYFERGSCQSMGKRVPRGMAASRENMGCRPNWLG